MSSFRLSPVVSAVVSANNVFSAKRISGQPLDALLDPIIGFDHFQLSGDVFGPHPHAGMSAITYLFEDSAPFRNLDSIGTDLIIQPGSLQWTFAGRGVVHNEFPEIDGQGINGLQLFINIPSAKKQMLSSPGPLVPLLSFLIPLVQILLNVSCFVANGSRRPGDPFLLSCNEYVNRFIPG